MALDAIRGRGPVPREGCDDVVSPKTLRQNKAIRNFLTLTFRNVV